MGFSDLQHDISIKAFNAALIKLKREYWSYKEFYVTRWTHTEAFSEADRQGIDGYVVLTHAPSEKSFFLLIQIKSSRFGMEDHLKRPGQDIPCVANDEDLPPLIEQLKTCISVYIDDIPLKPLSKEDEDFIEEAISRREEEAFREEKRKEFCQNFSIWQDERTKFKNQLTTEFEDGDIFWINYKDCIFLSDLINGGWKSEFSRTHRCQFNQGYLIYEAICFLIDERIELIHPNYKDEWGYRFNRWANEGTKPFEDPIDFIIEIRYAIECIDPIHSGAGFYNSVGVNFLRNLAEIDLRRYFDAYFFYKEIRVDSLNPGDIRKKNSVPSHYERDHKYSKDCYLCKYEKKSKTGLKLVS